MVDLNNQASNNQAVAKALMEAKGMNPDRHNWLYSFMNRTYTRYPLNDTYSILESSIYFVAYCKQCDQIASIEVPVSNDGSPRLNRAGLPKEGCDWGAKEENGSDTSAIPVK